MGWALLMLSIVVPLLFGLAKGTVIVSHTGFKNCIPVVFGILLGVILYRGLPFLSNLIPGEPIISCIIVVAVSVAISFIPMLCLRTTVPAILLYCFSTAPIGATLMLAVVDYACYFLRLFNIIKTELPFPYFSSPVDVFSVIVFLIVCLTTAITTTYTNYKVYAEEKGYDFEEGRTFYGPILGALLTGLAAAAAYLFLVPEIMRWRITKNVRLIPGGIPLRHFRKKIWHPIRLRDRLASNLVFTWECWWFSCSEPLRGTYSSA